MKFEFKNGSSVESFDFTGVEGNIRGKRAKNVYFARCPVISIKMRFIGFFKKCIGLFSEFEKARRH